METKIWFILSVLVLYITKSSCIPYQDTRIHLRQDSVEEEDQATTIRSDIDLVEIELENAEELLADDSINAIDSNTAQPIIVQNDDVETSETPSSNSTGLPYHVGNADCTCGKTVSKIVGGDIAKINDLPWTALLYKRSFFGFSKSAYCGGTVIASNYVLTASHCVDGMGARGIEVVLNEENISSTSESETQVFKVEKIIMHPEYSRRKIDNDIALLKLARPIDLSGAGPIVPACLPIITDDKFVGQNAIAAGWGATSEGGSVSKQLRKVTVPVISNEACNMTRYKGKITENMLCAGDVENGGSDSCQGDSGGPLVTSGDRKMVIGVVSWGYGCARPNSPGVYTRTAQYPEWILANTEGAEWCSN